MIQSAHGPFTDSFTASILVRNLGETGHIFMYILLFFFLSLSLSLSHSHISWIFCWNLFDVSSKLKAIALSFFPMRSWLINPKYRPGSFLSPTNHSNDIEMLLGRWFRFLFKIKIHRFSGSCFLDFRGVFERSEHKVYEEGPLTALH